MYTGTLREAIGLKNVTINDNFFPGHFPQRPIMPGEGGRERESLCFVFPPSSTARRPVVTTAIAVIHAKANSHRIYCIITHVLNI